MRQRLLVSCLMCLIAFCMWAKDMTVQITDTKGIPVSGLSVTISGTISDGAGDYSTDVKGQFVVKRTSLNFLNMRVQSNYYSENYELVWDGTDKPVIVKMENYYWVTFALKGMTSDQYPLLQTVKIGTSESDYNVMRAECVWSQEGKFSLLYRGKDLYWSFTPTCIVGGVAANNTIDLSALPDNTITLSPLEGKQKVTLSLKDKTGTYVAGQCSINNFGSFDNLIIEAEPTVCYFSQGAYILSTEINEGGSMYYASQEKSITVTESPLEIIFSYENAKQLTIKVRDLDGKVLPDATVRYISRNEHRVDANGEVKYLAVPGTYQYIVEAALNSDGRMYELTESITIADQDVTAEASYEGKYFRIELNIQLPAFIADRNELQVSSYNGQFTYDEQTGNYIALLPPNSESERISIRYDQMWDKIIPLQINRDEKINVSFDEYHKVNFLTNDPNNYTLSNINIKRLNSDYDSYNNRYPQLKHLYLPEGDYSMAAMVTDVTTNEQYNTITPQMFTVTGADREMVYTLDKAAFHNATFTMIGLDGMPLAGAKIRVTGENRYNYMEIQKVTDTQGKVSIPLTNGHYNYQIDPRNNIAISRGNLNITGEDANIRISFENYKELTLRLTGDLLSEFSTESGINHQIFNHAAGIETYITWKERGEDEWISETYYLPKGNYGYTLNFNSNAYGNTIFKVPGSGFILNENRILPIELSSSNYHKVSFGLADEHGNNLPISSNDRLRIYAASSPLNEIYDESMKSAVYLPAGEYIAKCNKNDKYDTPIDIRPFSITDRTEHVVMTYKNIALTPLTIKMQGVSDDILNNEIEVAFYENGVEYTSFEFNSDNKIIQASVCAGTYTYQVRINDCNLFSGTVTLPDDKELILDLSSYNYLQITFKNSAGEMIEFDDDEIMLAVYQGNEIVYKNWIYPQEDILLKEGTYKVWAWTEGFNSAEINLTINKKETQAEMIFTQAIANTYPIYFYVTNSYGGDENLSNATVTLEGLGIHPLVWGTCIYAGVAPGTYRYTITADGYNTYSGTVTVSEEMLLGGIIPVYAVLQFAPTGIETGKVSENNFRIWEAGGYLHIATSYEEAGQWSIRLISMNGATVYADRQQLEGEQQFYIGNQPRGFYLLILENGKQRIAYKIAKNR